MGKLSRCVVAVSDNEIWSPELNKKHNSVHGQTSNPLILTDNSRKSS